GTSLAVSGRTMPPDVESGGGMRSTMTRSASGLSSGVIVLSAESYNRLIRRGSPPLSARGRLSNRGGHEGSALVEFPLPASERHRNTPRHQGASHGSPDFPSAESARAQGTAP